MPSSAEPAVTPNLAKDLFLTLASLPPDQGRRGLAEAWGADAELRARVEALLAAHDESGTGAWARADEAPTTPPRALPSGGLGGEAAGALVGRCKLLQKLGEGGM